MAKYKITDKTTGRTMVVSGEAPPSPEDVDYLFSTVPAKEASVPQAPVMKKETPMGSPMDYLNEAVGGAARGIAGLGDILQSPYQLARQAFGKEPQSLTSLVTPKGAFAGEGVATDIASTAGEFGVSALSFGTAARGLVSNLLDDALKQGESAFRGVLRQLGSSTPVEDVVAGIVSGAGKETGGAAGERMGGADGRAIGEGLGGFGAPLAVAPLLFRLTRQLEPLITEAAPSIPELKGASRALYKQVEDMGIVFNEKATKTIADDLERIATEDSLTNLRGESVLAGQYRKVRDMLTQTGEFNGTTFSVLDKARTAFGDISKGTDNEARIAKRLADSIDDWLLGASSADIAPFKVDNLGKLLPSAGSVINQTERVEVSKALLTARSLWRRGKAGETINTAFEDARIASLGEGGGDYVELLSSNLRSMLRNETTARVFSGKEKAMIEATLKGGSLRNMFELAGNAGIKSNDMVKAMVYGSIFTIMAGGSGAQVGVGTAAFAIAQLLSKGAGVIAKNFLKEDARVMEAAIRAGPNARALTRIYMAKVKPADRKVEELSALFKASGADVGQLANTPLAKSKFVSDAILFTNMWDQAASEEAALNGKQ